MFLKYWSFGFIALFFVLPGVAWPVQSAGETAASEPQSSASSRQSPDESPKAKSTGTSIEEFRHFLRIGRNEKGKATCLETSVTRYIGKNSEGEMVFVDLIGVVHVGEKDYYYQLNRLFESYEAVLYELVAPEGTVIPRGGRGVEDSMNPVAGLQLGMKSALGLEFQLDHIDYTRENFVHADMTPEEFSKSMTDNDESVTKYFLRAIGQSIAMQAKGSTTDADLLAAILSRDRAKALRKVFAEQMQNMEASMSVFRGREGSTIIDHRNAKALKVLKEEIDAGKTRVAVFYGAGHLPDMQRRLIEDFGMKRGGQNWLTAWIIADE